MQGRKAEKDEVDRMSHEKLIQLLLSEFALSAVLILNSRTTPFPY